MLRSLFSGVSGLRAHQTMLDVVGNNIANVNTTGFKASSVEFEDTLSQALKAAGATAIDAIATHALFAPEMVRRLLDAGIRSVRSTDSVPHPTNAITLDQVLADVLRKELSP